MHTNIQTYKKEEKKTKSKFIDITPKTCAHTNTYTNIHKHVHTYGHDMQPYPLIHTPSPILKHAFAVLA